MVRASEQRASDAERDEVVELLRNAAAEGRIDHHELDNRVARALTARTYRELNATIADIPRSRSTRTLNAARPTTVSRKVGGWAFTAVRNEPWLLVFIVPLAAVALSLMMAALMMWMIVAVAMLALGGRRHGAPGLTARGGGRVRVQHGARGLAGSAGRWL
jgi:hypothetical protein